MVFLSSSYTSCIDIKASLRNEFSFLNALIVSSLLAITLSCRLKIVEIVFSTNTGSSVCPLVSEPISVYSTRLTNAEVPLLASMKIFSPSFLLMIVPDSISERTLSSGKAESLINSSKLIQDASAVLIVSSLFPCKPLILYPYFNF